MRLSGYNTSALSHTPTPKLTGVGQGVEQRLIAGVAVVAGRLVRAVGKRVATVAAAGVRQLTATTAGVQQRRRAVIVIVDAAAQAVVVRTAAHHILARRVLLRRRLQR